MWNSPEMGIRAGLLGGLAVLFASCDCGVTAGAPDSGLDGDAGLVADASVVEDAGALDGGGRDDAGEQNDAGDPDAGGPDAGPREGLLLTVTAELAGGIALAWDAGSLDLTSFKVRRDGVVIATLPGTAREFFDRDAGPGLLATIDAGASRGLTDGIELTWNLRGTRGATSTYEVSSSPSFASNTVTASRDVPTVTGWLITRTDGGTESLDASTRSWLDVGALPPSAGGSPGITAWADDSTSAVMLSSDASVVVADTEYSIEPVTFDGLVSEETCSGARGGPLVFQWQRSTDDSLTTFVDLPMVHGPWWFDAEAVFNEGRYYRLVVKRGAAITAVSAPARALLWRPRAIAASEGVCVLRDDDVALCAGSLGPFRGTTPLRDAVTFVTDGTRPCALHSDGGVTCIVNGVEEQIGLPAVSELVGNRRLCGRTSTGWVCAGPIWPLPQFTSLFSSNDYSTVCGRTIDDGGATCVSSGIHPPVEFGDVELLGVGDDQVCAIADGGIRCGPGLPETLPASSLGFTDLMVTWAHWGFYVRQTDGFVLCSAESGTYWGSNPPLSSEPFDRFALSASHPSFGCGLTSDHRLRCGGEGFRQLPPTQPVRQVELLGNFEGPYFLLENGRLAGRGRMLAHRGPGTDDRFVQVATGGWQTNGKVCGLRSDGSALCWSWSAGEVQPASAKQYVAIAMNLYSSCGLERDGSISCWRGGWVPTGTFIGLSRIDESLCGQRADLSFTCDSSLTPALPSGTSFTKVTSNGSEACGIKTDGSLQCWPTPAPPSTRGQKFRDVANGRGSLTTCAVAMDGATECWGGDIRSPPWNDFVSIKVAAHACGVRTDQTATCWGSNRRWFFDP